MEITRPSVLEVDVSAFMHNVNEIQKYIGADKKIMPVIKAEGYGTFINRRIDILNNFDIVAVALVDEAVKLREAGYSKEIFVLNQPYKDEIEKIIKYDVIIGISSESFVEELGKYNNDIIKVHIEIGTGMGRTGIHPNRTEEYIEKIRQYSNIEIQGIYTHLSSADCDDEYTVKQIKSFENAVEKAKNMVNLKYIHCLASNGILNYKNAIGNLVRSGIILYGFESYEGAKEKIDIKPISKLKSKITFLKEVEAGTSIGYSRSYITTRKTKVATVPIGYADGIRRSLSNKGEVVINNQKVPIIGNICMDSFMVDVTDLENVSLGDDVYIWDNNIITLEDVAKIDNTINYEIMSTISERVPRVFIS